MNRGERHGEGRDIGKVKKSNLVEKNILQYEL